MIIATKGSHIFGAYSTGIMLWTQGILYPRLGPSFPELKDAVAGRAGGDWCGFTFAFVFFLPVDADAGARPKHVNPKEPPAPSARPSLPPHVLMTCSLPPP